MLNPIEATSFYAYGNTLAACSIAITLCANALPDIDKHCVTCFYDHDGSFTELDRLFSTVKKGDQVVLASLFSLDDPDDKMAMVHRLHKFQRKGVEIHTVLGPTISIEQYDDMLKIWHLLQKQKREFLICCGAHPYEIEV